ncbi:MAG: type 4a pilus biogenesis protein PilO [Desulfomonile tiedjei]|nr:type 4a pilus biogenesis protein PilO [Desulfomonile tiedjei]
MTVEEVFFKINRIQRILIVVAIAVLLLVGFYFLVIYEMQDQIAKLEQSIGRIKLEIMNQEKILQEGPKLKTRIEELRKRLQTMVASLPEKQDIEQLLKKITDLMSESNLVAKRFVPGQEQINEELYYATIPIQLNVRGDYQKQGAFLASLNTLPRIVNVPTIRLIRAGGLSVRETDLARKLDVIPLDGDISGVTYRRLSQDEIQAIAKKKQAAPQKPAGRRR